jgi:hypothetical protein
MYEIMPHNVIKKQNMMRVLSNKLMKLLNLRARDAAVAGARECAVQTVYGAMVRLHSTLVDVREVENFHGAQPAEAAAKQLHVAAHVKRGLRASHARRCRQGGWSSGGARRTLVSCAVSCCPEASGVESRWRRAIVLLT